MKEFGAGEQNLFFDLKVLSQVARGLKELGYKFVTADLEGYRSGSFDHKFK
jgi:PP-loop superfamily ATP-utilizing enzyme